MNTHTTPGEIPGPALFTLDLGLNGGILAPRSYEEAISWLQHERSSWDWASKIAGPNKGVLAGALKNLSQAEKAMVAAQGFRSTGEASREEGTLANAQDALRATFLDRKLPHSRSASGKRIAQLAQVQRAVALAYTAVHLEPMPGESWQEYDTSNVDAWHGLVAGLIDRFGLLDDSQETVRAARHAFEEATTDAEHFLSEKRGAIDAMQREALAVREELGATKLTQEIEFQSLTTSCREEHARALVEHDGQMKALQKAYREEMALRGPVEYWSDKASKHAVKASEWMQRTFFGMGALGAVLAGLAAWVFLTLDQGKPDAWKVAIAVLIGVLGVWAIRLFVRLYMSHEHLANDADERVTMVKTYLALLEGDKMPSDEDRALVLTPLFRPAADGIVKDETLPHPLLELLTKRP